MLKAHAKVIPLHLESYVYKGATLGKNDKTYISKSAFPWDVASSSMCGSSSMPKLGDPLAAPGVSQVKSVK